jgi:hypothetical protein
MNTFRKLFKFFFGEYYAMIASTASIVSIVIIFAPIPNQSIFALATFVIFLLIILFRILWLIDYTLKSRNTSDLLNFATIIKHTISETNQVSSELYKFVQCKHALITEYEHPYYWTGSREPKITSSTQKFIGTTKSGNDKYDKAHFSFQSPLIYNQVSVIHVKMDIDDSDNKSDPFLEMRVPNIISFIQFKVELRNKKSGKTPNAVLKRKKMDGTKNHDFELLEDVIFDLSSKSYECTLVYPAIGYFYRLEWKK